MLSYWFIDGKLKFIITYPVSTVKVKSLPIQDEPERFRQLVYDWDMRLIMNDRQLQTVDYYCSKDEHSRGHKSQDGYTQVTEPLNTHTAVTSLM